MMEKMEFFTRPEPGDVLTDGRTVVEVGAHWSNYFRSGWWVATDDQTDE